MINNIETMEKLLYTKFGYAFLLSATAYPIIEFVEKYIFSDWQFAIFLIVVIAIDTVLGFIKHWISGTLSSSGWAKLFTKVMVYTSVLVLTHALTKYTVEGSENGIFSWFDSVMYSAIMVREAISILENIGAINPNILPSWILKRLKTFDKSGNVKDLTNETN